MGQDLVETTRLLWDRWAKYRAGDLDLTISPKDDMLEPLQLDQYLSVGTSAIEVISDAMLLARKTQIPKVLDMPCGSGRVTRHLVKFFPESEIFVSDLDKEKQRFVSSIFRTTAIDLPPDFLGEPSRRFDLIFVGSLLTHLNADLATNVLRYLVNALSEGGLLIFTTHGRHAVALAAAAGQLLERPLRRFLKHGFCYRGGKTYGDSRMAASWVLRTIEASPDVRVIAHMERGWAQFQDVYVVEKSTGWTIARPAPARWLAQLRA